MSNTSIKKNYLKKIKLLKKYNKFYYDKSKPLISDKEYDELKQDIFNIEKSNPDLISKESPSLTVGFLWPMLLMKKI